MNCAKRLSAFFRLFISYVGIHTTREKAISHQYKQKYNQNIYSAEFDTTLIGSDVIRAIQMGLKVRGYYSSAIEGLCGEATIKAMQKALGTTVDGVISPVSDMAKALQRALNKCKKEIARFGGLVSINVIGWLK